MAPPSNRASVESLPGPSPRNVALAGIGVWVLLCLAFGSQSYATYAVKKEPISFWMAVIWAVNAWVGWLLMAPLVFWLARKLPLRAPGLGRKVAIHFVVGSVLAFANGLIYFVAEWLTDELDHGEISMGNMALLYGIKNMVLGLLAYSVLVGAEHGLEFYRRYREREQREAQLNAQLSKAQLEVLKMQLQPHFLFNTLHAISALVHKDPDSADRIITRLGDLLRLSLQSNGTQEVTLKQELEFVEKYVDIQRTRFRDRLVIRVRTEPETAAAMVPSLLLQPLIENSIKHGVEREEKPAEIDVVARRAGTRLVLTVTDNGPGFPENILTPLPGRGLGLSNTRARLAALYGNEGQLTIGAAPGGGALVTIDIPWRTTNDA